MSLLNDYRISHGNPPLGFLNPFLYSKGVAGLVDILVCAFPFEREAQNLVLTRFTPFIDWVQPGLWDRRILRDCWLGSGEYLPHCFLSELSC